MYLNIDCNRNILRLEFEKALLNLFLKSLHRQSRHFTALAQTCKVLALPYL